MTLERIALVYDNTLRPETTGVYCQRALSTLADVRHFLPTELERIPRNEFDFYLNIDDGLKYAWPEDLHPAAFWAIDTHIDFSRSLKKSSDFDLVYAAQKEGADRLRQAKIESALWLPLACDPELHRKHDLAKKHQIAFVGNIFSGSRSELLQAIQQNFDKVIVTQAYFDAMARIYSESKLVFNRSVANDLNMRVFEALACGSLLVTNALEGNGQNELFQDCVHFSTYRNSAELLERIRYFLEHDEERDRIAQEGRAEVLAKHTYRHRMVALLASMQEFLEHRNTVKPESTILASSEKSHSGQVLSRSEDESPWELLELVPKFAQRILHVGPGAATFASGIKQRQTAEVWGIERESKLIQTVEFSIDRLLRGNIESLVNDLPDRSFDCVVFRDVLEYLVDPDELLSQAKRCLADNGIVVASIPNVRNRSRIGSLLAGSGIYETESVRDEAALHFFTRLDIEEMINNAGYRIQSIRAVPDDSRLGRRKEDRSETVSFAEYSFSANGATDAGEFFVERFIVSATPVSSSISGASLARDSLEQTRNVEKNRCLTSNTQRSIFDDWSISQHCWETIRPLLKPGMKTLECGSGLSTLLFEAAGCDHLALEHDSRYAAPSRSVRLVPLDENSRWYDWKPETCFDLILVDGPPGFIGRKGILRVLTECLHEETILVLDDSHRDEERRLVNGIAEQFHYEFEFHDSQNRQFALGRRIAKFPTDSSNSFDHSAS